jgi:hypothetical protein
MGLKGIPMDLTRKPISSVDSRRSPTTSRAVLQDRCPVHANVYIEESHKPFYRLKLIKIR